MFDSWVGKIPCRRAWQPTPVFLPGESHGQRSLASDSPWGHKVSDMTEWLTHAHTHTHTEFLMSHNLETNCLGIANYPSFAQHQLKFWRWTLFPLILLSSIVSSCGAFTVINYIYPERAGLNDPVAKTRQESLFPSWIIKKNVIAFTCTNSTTM